MRSGLGARSCHSSSPLPNFGFRRAARRPADLVPAPSKRAAQRHHHPLFSPAVGLPDFFCVFARVARSFGHFDDVLTAGTGGDPGFFRIPLHVSGAASSAWQNGFGSVSLSFDCVSSVPGSPFAIGHCPNVLLDFSGDEYFDTVVNLDVPIVLGAPFEYRVAGGITATCGHDYGDLIPFEGHAGGLRRPAPALGRVGPRRKRHADPERTDLGFGVGHRVCAGADLGRERRGRPRRDWRAGAARAADAAARIGLRPVAARNLFAHALRKRRIAADHAEEALA